MDVLNRIKYQVTNVLPGNPITKDFEILNLSCVCGPGFLWKVYDAKIRSSKQDASVWIFEKKLVDKMSRNTKEDVIQLAKKGVINLTKLRHPKILSVVHPLEESRESLAFATEPVYVCLGNIFHPDLNLPHSVISEIKEHKLFDTEIKHGILQICEALAFLHSDCKQFHLNICPENIIIIKNGSWKLAGFEFSVASAMGVSNTARDTVGDQTISVAEWQSSYPPIAQPKLNYCSPEMSLQGRAVPASDMFSVGMLIIALHNEGKPLFDCNDDINVYRKNANELNNIRVSLLQCLPESIRDYVKLLLKYESSLRPDAHQLTKISYFNDPGVTVLLSMDNLYQLDNLARSQFYKTLPKTVMTMPKRINIHRILPQLAVEFNNNNMVPFVLPTVLQIADLCTEVEFSRYLLPKLIPVFSMSDPVQIILIFLQNLTIMMSKCPENEFKSYILPMMNRALEVDNRQTQELCLKILPTIAHMMAFSTLKNIIVTRLKKLCLSSSIVDIKVLCLICIGKLMEHMDKWFVLDDILPILPDIKSKDPAVLMSILGIYQIAFDHKKLGITKEILATVALPFLLPLSIDNNLNLTQYSAFMNLIQQMIAKLDAEHRSKLEQINGLQQEYKSMPIGVTAESASNEINTASSALLTEIGDVFGLKLNGNSVSPQTLVQYNPSAISSTNAAIATNLSLEDKRRLADQQEQLSRFKTQQKDRSIIVPKSVQPEKKINLSRDLTSTLMDRNLALMGNSNIGGSANNSASGSYNLAPFTNGGFKTSPMSVPMQQPPPPSQKSQVDSSAFDGICNLGSSNRPKLNEISSRTTIAMNNHMQLLSTNQNRPIVLSDNNRSNSGASKLSINDIDDLLK